MIRQLSPIDLPYLIPIRSMLSYDKACPRDNLGISQHTMTAMEVFLGQWVNFKLRQRQQSWICTDEKRILGFASARCCTESFAWEIDHLLLTRNDGKGICGDLLHTIAIDSRSWSAQRIFLRLAANSPLLNNICQVGFTPYLRECLYQLNTRWQGEKTDKTARLTIRPVGKDDEYRIFELYNTAFPASVRRVEGITFGEWKEVRGSLACQQWKKQYLGEYKSDIKAQFKITTQGNIGQFEAIIHSEENVEEILSQIIRYVSGFSIVRCLVPGHDVVLASALKSLGFIPIAEYDVLANLSAIRVDGPELMPVHI